ncbi:helix-turn-helix transcriptional regulator [Roseateles chitinivorans]|uniref:helix-turn-helix transcriptional regulator n=1 Tax=Roseateles chitinivorans TaxID=2917965 RepID=UPI003D66E188
MNMFARSAEAAGPEVARPHGPTGGRVRAARELAKLTQAQLSDRVGFGDRQTLSAIENGERRLQPSELIKISKVLERPLEWFIDPFVVEGEAHFSWRVSRAVTDNALYAFEAKVGRMVGLLRHLKVALKGKSPLLIPTLRASEESSFEEAWLWGRVLPSN